MEKLEAYYFIGKRSVYGMDFQLELGFYGTPALPRSVCCPVVALQQNPEPFAQVTLLRPPRPPLLTNFCVWCLCIFSVLFYAGIARAPPASVGCVFLRIVLLDFLGSSLSFQCRTLRFPKNRTRAFLLVVARCAASDLWKSFNEAFDVIGKRSVYGMQISQNLQNFAKFQNFQLDNLVDFEKCCKTRIFLQKSVPI